MSTSKELQPLMKAKMAPQQHLRGRRPLWHSYKHPEVKHELIIIAELSAAAALVVGLYLIALLPFEYIHRAQMLSTRLQPKNVTLEDSEKFYNRCIATQPHGIPRNISNTIAFQLTNPNACGAKELSPRGFIYKKETWGNTPIQNTFSLGLPKYRNGGSKLYSYHELINFFYIPCADSSSDDHCPCGYNHVFQNKCYTLVQDGLQADKCGRFGSVNTTVNPADIKHYLASQKFNKYSVNGTTYNVNDIVHGHGSTSTKDMDFLKDGTTQEFKLCEANLIDETQWWRLRPERTYDGKIVL